MSSTLAQSTTLGALPFIASERYGDQPSQRFKKDGGWETLSHAQVATITDELARGLVGLGVQPGERVAILCETRPEWMQVAFAIAAAGGVVVPIYATNSPQECDWVLRDSGSVAVVCENAAQAAKVAVIADGLPDLRHVLTIEPVDGHDDVSVLRERGREGSAETRLERTQGRQVDDAAIIIYTSGTTGKPKGCVLTHGNLMSCAQQAKDLDLVHAGEVSYLFLPLAHVFAQTSNIAATAMGMETAYVSNGSASIMDDLAEVRPHYFPSVPRIFEKVHSAFADLSRDDELFAKVRAAFGGRVRVAITGAAPIAPDILEFFAAAGVPIYEGYGLSESTSYATVNTPDDLRIGSIGKAMPFGEVEIDDDGEILLRGPHVFAGYLNNDSATAATMTEDGWLRTGDLGRIDEDGFVWITGRKKEIIITAGGKNIAPSEIENELRQSPMISHVVMHGDRRPYPVALITLDPDHMASWAAERGLSSDPIAWADDPVVHRTVSQIVDAVNVKHSKVAQIKKFAILARDFSQETGELTPTLKMKRAAIVTKYSEVLDVLYRDAGAPSEDDSSPTTQERERTS